ncbi:MAG: TonB-dependent receptor [Gammaproteobacteria bacterium]|nr:TonB-dependent receptor [Gammaproteobacteria bacterium]MDH3362256.1 TonB-dependent receptor [Gammaproteobacteria bacterium]MDH3480286.1 TonB-dependent receptor [Gammaproteobacteria bacterium]
MSSNSNLQTAVRLGLGIGAGALAAGFAPGALAQGADQEVAIEEIITTGSRIKRADIDSASPVTVLQRDDILASGLTDVGNIIQKMPSMSGSPIGTTTNNGGNGAVLIDLRGMGVDRTLTLVNGQRVVDGGDYQTIPSAMIERVEILKDGASAVYGADAVAGVVNIITRRDFEGIEVSAQTADWFDTKSGAQNSINVIAGTTFDAGNIVFGAEFVDQEEAYQRDVPWDYFQNSYYIYPEGCENQVAAPYDGTPSGGCYAIGSSRIPEGRLNTLELTDRGASRGGLFDWFNGEDQFDDDDNPNPAFDPAFGVPVFRNGNTFMNPGGTGLVPYDGRTYNYAPVNYMQTPYKRTNIFAEAHFELTENLRFNAEVRGNNRTSSQELAPQPYNSPTDPAYQGSWTQIDPNTGLPLRRVAGVNADGDDVFFYTADQGLGEVVPAVSYSGISEDNFYNPFGFPIRDARRRMIETTRRFTQDITQYQFVASLEGAINDNLDWEVFWNRGYRSRVDNDFGQFSGPRLAQAMGPSADLDGDGSPECYQDINDPSTLIAGCVPFNFFGGGSVDPVGSVPTFTSVTPAMLDWVGIDLIDTFVTDQELWGASLSGSAWELPGGEFGWAAGYGYWGQKFRYSPDSAKQIDAVTGNTGVGTLGSLYNNSLFVEVFAPVFDNGEQAIDLKAGVRYDDWSAFDADTTWQFGVEFQAIEAVKLRATAGTVFRAPTISDLFAGQQDSFPTYVDPCAQGAPLPPGCSGPGVQLDNQVLARVGGNPFLQPETGDTFTAGFVFSPELPVGDGTLTLDYWQVDIEDGISSLGVQFILDDCYVNNNPSSCSLITRRPDGTIAQIIDGSLNVAEQGARGVDTEIRYNFETDIGDWEASLLWAHLLERTKTASPGDVEQDLSGRYTDPTAEDGGAYATDKINVSLQWQREGLSIGYLGEFISDLDADTFCNCGAGNQPDGSYIQAVDSVMFHDIVGNYDFGQGTRVSAGITNITDEEPPFIEVGFNASTDPSTYRLFGMGYYLRLSHTFE